MVGWCTTLQEGESQGSSPVAASPSTVPPVPTLAQLATLPIITSTLPAFPTLSPTMPELQPAHQPTMGLHQRTQSNPQPTTTHHPPFPEPNHTTEHHHLHPHASENLHPPPESAEHPQPQTGEIAQPHIEHPLLHPLPEHPIPHPEHPLPLPTDFPPVKREELPTKAKAPVAKPNTDTNFAELSGDKLTMAQVWWGILWYGMATSPGAARAPWD